MRRFQVPGRQPETSVGVSASERKRLMLLSIATVGVAISVVWLWMKSKTYTPSDERVPEWESEEVEETLALPEIDAARIDALVADERPEQRVLLESEGLDEILAPARTLTSRHFEAMGTEELDAQRSAELIAEPSAQRGRPFTARGWIETLRVRMRGAAGSLEHIARLTLEDESAVHVLTLSVPEDIEIDEYVRVDGLFLKVFSDEDLEESGTWIEGPLLVGPRMIHSYPSSGKVLELDPKYLVTVEDDVLMTEEGTAGRWAGLPFDALWHLMAYVRDLPEGAVDWSSVPELDRETLREIASDGQPHRLLPYRIPISRLQGIRVRRAGENPPRIEEYTTGWIGNTTWKDVIHFQSPFPYEEFRTPDYVYGNGFFLKNFAYESARVGVRTAPAFVVHSLEKLEPKADPLLRIFGYVVAGLTLVFLIAFSMLLTRDKRKNQALQEELRRRRQARRARRAEEQAADTNPQ
jgi:hypothetical protein